jgi:hypothetical protein
MRRSLIAREKCPHERSPAAGSARRHRWLNDPATKMRIRTDSAASAASLAEYLRRCECVVDVIDSRIIDATARPQSFAAPHADVELEGYLAVWQAMHPECWTERLTPLANS